MVYLAFLPLTDLFWYRSFGIRIYPRGIAILYGLDGVWIYYRNLSEIGLVYNYREQC